jgi:hypothetical protein
MKLYPILRYADVRVLHSVLDPYQDVKNLITALCSRGFVKDILILRHHLPSGEATKRAERIVAHVKTALQFLEQAEGCAVEVSFLPAYYAILNLLKVYILAGPFADSLQDESQHGATRKSGTRMRRGLLTETVELHSRGALSLFLRTSTGDALKPDKQTVKIGHLYPLIVDIASELDLTSGSSGCTVQVAVGERHEPGRKLKRIPFIEVGHDDKTVASSRPWAFRGRLRKVSTVPARFEVPGLTIPQGKSAQEVLRPFIATDFLYYPMGGFSLVSLAPKKLQFPEEFPLALLFFHMSSVTRYNPEFLWAIRDSQHWPIVAAARRHGLFKMLLLFWCFMQKETLLINHNI